MAIVIPNRRTLMDHLADVGSRYVQNKAETDRQRMAQQFQMNRDEQSQEFMLDRDKQTQGFDERISDKRNEFIAANTKAQNDFNLLFQKGDFAGRRALSEQEGENSIGVANVGLKGVESTNATNKAMALDRNATEKYIADLGSRTQIQLQTDLNLLNQKLAEMKNQTDKDINFQTTYSQLEGIIARVEGQLKATELTTNASIQNVDRTVTGNENIAGTQAGVQRYGIDQNYQMNLDNIFSQENLASMGYASQKELQDADLLFRGKTMGAALVAQQENAEADRKFQLKLQKNDQIFQSRESDKAYDFQTLISAEDRELKKQQLEQTEWVFNNVTKNPGGAMARELEPLLKANGITMDQFLNPQKDGRIMGGIKALLNGRPLAAIFNLALRYNAGYDNEIDRANNVTAGANRLYGTPTPTE